MVKLAIKNVLQGKIHNYANEPLSNTNYLDDFLIKSGFWERLYWILLEFDKRSFSQHSI